MSDHTPPERRSPLAHRSPIAAERDVVRLAEIPLLAKHILRVDPDTGAEPVKETFGLDLPVEPL
ncbi:MAG TPA: hypothetical protein VLA28_04190, partial [Afifellaceae bacterium]|nr:hypothetical protein [Afifellaceae bacterium]